MTRIVAALSSILGSYKMVPIHLILILLLSKTSKVSNFVISYLIGAPLLFIIKESVAYPRPCHACSADSFPSGHAWYVATLVTSMWPFMTRTAKALCCAIAVFVCYSRVLLAQHFPADVLYGAGLGAAVSICVRIRKQAAV